MKRVVFFLLLSFFSLSTSFPQVNLEIHIEPVKVLFVEKDEKIINLTITNKTMDSFELQFTNELAGNISVEVYDELDFPIIMNPQLQNIRQNLHPDFTLLTLKPNASYSMSFSLDDFVLIESPGVYSIITRFFPFTINRSEYSTSNTVLVSILKEPLPYENTFLQEELEFYYEGVKKTDLDSPDKVVQLALTFLQKGNWEGFLATVDLRALYLNTVQVPEYFNSLNYPQQRKELLAFIQKTKNEDIYSYLFHSDDFSIENTKYTNTMATITTLVNNSQALARNTRRYTFYLSKQRHQWKITNYNVSILGNSQIRKRENTQDIESPFYDFIPADFVVKE